MEQSLTLLSAQVHFLDTELALIHIPLHLYTAFLQPILRLLITTDSDSDGTNEDPSTSIDHVSVRRPWAYQHAFVNISITPVECSVVCPRVLANEYFVSTRNCLEEATRKQVSISKDDYVVMQVDGEGLDAGQRVLELTSPLAMNGISIFFITTYFSDYILVPAKSRPAVIDALEARGFAFEEQTEAFVNIASPFLQSSQFVNVANHNHSPSLSSTHENPYEASIKASPVLSAQCPPPTPPPSSVDELQRRTFALLERRNIAPQVDPTIQLVQCAERKDTLRAGKGPHASSLGADMRLQLGLVKCLIASPRARFLSLTLTDTEPASLLLQKHLLANFCQGNDVAGDEVLLGNKHDVLVPIILDLRELPLESTGIVCGIAGRLVGATGRSDGDDQFGSAADMSYLSTARAGTVMVAEVDLANALKALRGATNV